MSIGTATDINELGAISALSAYAIPGGETLAELDVAASVDANFIVTGEDALQFRDRSDVRPGRGDWDDIDPFAHDVVLTTSGFGRLRVDLAVAMPAGRITRLEPIAWRFLEAHETHEPPVLSQDEWDYEDDDDS